FDVRRIVLVAHAVAARTGRDRKRKRAAVGQAAAETAAVGPGLDLHVIQVALAMIELRAQARPLAGIHFDQPARFRADRAERHAARARLVPGRELIGGRALQGLAAGTRVRGFVALVPELGAVVVGIARAR